MSIVERAIKKLQDSQSRQPVEPVPKGPDTGGSARHAPADSLDVTDAPALKTPPLVHHPKRTVSFDLDRLRAHRLMPSVDQERQISAQYRHIKRPLVNRAMGRDGERKRRANALIVLSALPGEGKTFTALNLALSIALEQDVEVLLVDADVGRPRLTREFALEGEVGLLDALVDDSIDIESLVVPTDLPSLGLLPSGTLSGRATELLASARMDEVVEQLCGLRRNRIVIFDSPPLLPTTEARVLARDMGQVVMIVRAGATPRQAVFESLELLGERDDINLVLTHAHVEGAGSYYYGSYGFEAYG